MFNLVPRLYKTFQCCLSTFVFLLLVYQLLFYRLQNFICLFFKLFKFINFIYMTCQFFSHKKKVTNYFFFNQDIFELVPVFIRTFLYGKFINFLLSCQLLYAILINLFNYQPQLKRLPNFIQLSYYRVLHYQLLFELVTNVNFVSLNYRHLSPIFFFIIIYKLSFTFLTKSLT